MERIMIISETMIIGSYCALFLANMIVMPYIDIHPSVLNPLYSNIDIINYIQLCGFLILFIISIINIIDSFNENITKEPIIFP